MDLAGLPSCGEGALEALLARWQGLLCGPAADSNGENLSTASAAGMGPALWQYRHIPLCHAMEQWLQGKAKPYLRRFPRSKDCCPAPSAAVASPLPLTPQAESSSH